jgi:hypothetical protein
VYLGLFFCGDIPTTITGPRSEVRAEDRRILWIQRIYEKFSFDWLEVESLSDSSDVVFQLLDNEFLFRNEGFNDITNRNHTRHFVVLQYR